MGKSQVVVSSEFQPLVEDLRRAEAELTKAEIPYRAAADAHARAVRALNAALAKAGIGTRMVPTVRPADAKRRTLSPAAAQVLKAEESEESK